MLGDVIDEVAMANSNEKFPKGSDEEVLFSIINSARELFVTLESESGSNYAKPKTKESIDGVQYTEDLHGYIHRLWSMKQKSNKEYHGVYGELLVSTRAGNELEMHAQALERAESMLDKHPEYQRIAIREAKKAGHEFLANHILPFKFARNRVA